MGEYTTTAENITGVKRSQSLFVCWGSAGDPVVIWAAGPRSMFLKLPKSELSSILKKPVFDRIQKSSTLQRRFICDERKITPGAIRALKGRFLSIALIEIRQRRQVFPCNGKRPYTKTGVLEATTEKSLIWQWSLRWPNANCGIAFNEDSPEVGVDVDAKNMQWLDRIQHQEGIIETRTVRTGGGGFHFYFRRPAGIDLPNVSDLAHKGFELKSKHSYLMAAGCIHPDTGKVYELTHDIDPQPMPDWLVKLALESGQPSPNPSPNPSPTSPTPAGLTIPRGEHDAWLFKMARMYRGQGDTEDIIYSKLKLDLTRLADIDPTKPYTERDLHRIAKSAGKYSVNPRLQVPTVSSTPPPIAVPELKIPEIAWRGLFAEYRDLVGPTTEAPDAFHYGMFLQVLGCTLGTRLRIYNANDIFPNFYVCLVGTSSSPRKSTVMARGMQILEGLHTQSDPTLNSPPFRRLNGIRSWEGLLDSLEGENKVRLVNLDEITNLLNKARQDSTGNLISELTSIYACPPKYDTTVKGRAINCKRPFLSIMAATTPDWLFKSMSEGDIHGGFANRWMFFQSPPKDPIPRPPKMDPTRLSKLIANINQIRVWADDVPGGEITVSKEAEDRFDPHYRQLFTRGEASGLIPTLIRRIQDFIWKIALLYAAERLSEKISRDDMEAAIEVGNYLEASVARVFANYGSSKGKEIETKVIEYLRSKGPVDARIIYNALNLSSGEFDKVIKDLARLGLVRPGSRRGANGRTVTTYEVVNVV
jgi:hypothetical protein